MEKLEQKELLEKMLKDETYLVEYNSKELYKAEILERDFEIKYHTNKIKEHSNNITKIICKLADLTIK